MANKGLGEKIKHIFENLTVLQERLDKIVETLPEKEFKEKLDKKLSNLEDNQKRLNESLCIKIDDLIDLLKLLHTGDRCLTIDDLRSFFKEGEDNSEKIQEIEEEKEYKFFAPLP